MATVEQIDNYREWLRRERAAQRRVDAKIYAYDQPQNMAGYCDDDALSLASIDDELGQLADECRFTVDELAQMEHEADNPPTKKRRSR